MKSAARREAEYALDLLLPRFGVPVAHHVAGTPDGPTPYLVAGAGPPVVLLHGGFGGAGNWHRTLGPVSQRYRVIAPDRPGYGLSATPASDDEVAWLSGFLDARHIERPALAGHASGAALALAYARAYPARVRALAISDVWLTDPTTEPTSASSSSGAPGPRTPAAWAASLGARFDDRRALAPEYVYYLWCLAQLHPAQDQRPPGDIAPGPVPLPQPGERTWPTLPCLLIWGRNNRWSSAERARQLHQRVLDAWLRVVEHSRGIPPLEQPGHFNLALISFLERYVQAP